MSILELSLKFILEQVISKQTNGSAFMYKQTMCRLNIDQLIHRNGRINWSRRYNSVPNTTLFVSFHA